MLSSHLSRGRARRGRVLTVFTAFSLCFQGIALVALPRAASAAGTNPIVVENAKPGSPPSEWDIDGAGSPTIQGFATQISVAAGETVGFKVDTAATAYRVDIYRLGYYGGDGARHVATVQPSAALPQTQPDCLTDDATGLIDCGNWSLSASWAVPADAVSGIYIAKLVRTDGTEGASHIPFVVRDDSRHAALLFQTSDTTWQAYNQYGGNSLYVGQPAGRAYKVSYNRPITTRGTSAEDFVFNAEYPMVRWLEANGYDVSYQSGADTARSAAELLEHQVFMSVGHDEYWSADQRANVEAARDAGVNLAFFSSNEIFWKTRWEPSTDSSHTAYRTLVSYKETHANAKIDPLPDVWTGTWRDPRSFNPEGGKPENALSGQIFTVNCCASALQVPADAGRLRFWRNTDIAQLQTGQVATMPEGTVGYEWDEDLDNGARPAGLIRMSDTTVNVPERILDYGSNYGPGTANHALTLYRAPSGALVFGSGTLQWSWGLDSHHDRGSAPADRSMQQATVNLFADMNVQPATIQSGLTIAAKSTDTQAPVATITSPTTGTTVQSGTVTISGTATDTGGGVVGGVEVSLDGGSTWHRADGREHWTYRWSAREGTSANIVARATDDSANIGAATAAVQVSVAASTGPWSIWDDSATPQNQNVSDSRPIELGVRFTSDIDGYVTGIRFYKGSDNTGTHIGHLWTTTGTELARVTFAGESASGWQQAMFDAPVPVTAGTTYIASYYSPTGSFSDTPGEFNGLAVDNPPLHAPAHSLSAPNGVYLYDSDAFPTGGNGYNYWVDVVLAKDVGPDTTPPRVVTTVPASNANNVATSTLVSATFGEALDPATVSGSTFDLRDAANNVVAATVAYDAATHRATLEPAAVLANTTTYHATLRGGAAGVKDVAGNALASDVTWSFTTAAPAQPPADDGPGGPVLVIASAADPFGRYYGEILRAEGLDAYKVTDISRVTASTLDAYDVVILASMPLDDAQANMLAGWVDAGGNLVAMQPDARLASLLGLTSAGGTLANAYLRIDTSSAPGAGITGATMQFHGAATKYALAGARAVATLYSDATTSTANPAVTVRDVGSNGGSAAAFTYDLARSVVYTRQGNPAWAGQERDGVSPIRSDDLFFGGASEDRQADWVDLTKVAVPQADEQQRLLANLIEYVNADRTPLPRFWYFPRDEKAVVVMTGDDHGNGGTAGRFDALQAASAPGCSVADWECIRATSYVYPGTPLTDAQAQAYQAAGFEVALHINTDCNDWSPAQLAAYYDQQSASFAAQYPGVNTPVTERTHCISWSDWATQPKVELSHGIRLDTNYYFWPGTWLQDRPGMFTGSGIPMRFADTDGALIDVYQAPTQMTDESDQTYPKTIDALLDGALGANGYYGAFVANMHTDNASSAGSDAIVASAKRDGVPVVSASQMLTWLDGRNASSFGSVQRNGNTVGFNISVGNGANGLRAMLPVESANGTLSQLTRNGTPVAVTNQIVKGIDYAFFDAAPGAYAATYAAAPATHTVIDTTTSDFSAGSGTGTAVVHDGDGAVVLQPALNEDFDGATLPGGWAQSQWTAGSGTTTVANGAVSVDGTMAQTDSTYPAGTAVDFVATFGSQPYEHAGLTTDFDGQWAMFSTGANGGVLLARTKGPSSQETVIPGSWLGAPHHFRIVWGASTVTYYVDGTQVAEHPIALTAPMHAVASDFNPGGDVVSLDSMRVSPYAASGNFVSRVFDAGTDVTWGTFDVTASVPATAHVVYSVRTGATPVPDASWSAFHTVASGMSLGERGRYLQYRVDVTSDDTSSTPVLQRVAVDFDTTIDTQPPVVTVRTPAPGATDVGPNGNVSATFNEALDPASVDATAIRVRAQGASNDAAGSVSYDNATRTVTWSPSTPLEANRTYQVTVGHALRDASGNAFVNDETWTFTVAKARLVDTTVTDFQQGSGDAGVTVLPEGDGELTLASNAAVNEQFDGDALPNGWSTNVWNDGGAVTVANGALSVDGMSAAPTATSGPGQTLEFEATFGAASFQTVTFGQTLATADEPWIGFGTNTSTGTVYARVNVPGQPSLNVPIAGNLVGSTHTYRIDWYADHIVFSVDGNVVDTEQIAIGAQMRPIVSDYASGGPALRVDGLRLVSYAPAGTFTSRVLDAGEPVHFDAVASDTETPAGTSIAMRVRTGTTPVPDVSWSAWTTVANGSTIDATARYIQYDAVLGTSDPMGAPCIRSVTVTYDKVNTPPVAHDDAYATAEDATLHVAAQGVLANDTDANGDALTATLVQGPAHGALTLHANGSFDYVPAADYNGDDTFTYRAGDGQASSETVTVTITVNPVDDAPVVVADAYRTAAGTALRVAAPGVLANDHDVDGPALHASVVAAPKHGVLQLQASGAFVYTPASGFSGTDTFTYGAGDGTLSSSAATVVITVAKPATPPKPAATPPGYWMVEQRGRVHAFGHAKNYGNANSTSVTHLEPTASRHGYWIVDATGHVFAFGDAKSFGNANRSVFVAGEIVSSLSPTPTGKGYWLFTNRGRALPFGDARFYGDMSHVALNGPVVGSIATPTGRGYYMVASDGGIFAFGDAKFRGSMGAMKLNKPVMGLVPTADNGGYWLVASDGGIFAFGNAKFRGSMGAVKLNKPVVGMVRYGNGYLMVGADGGIFNFSSTPFLGSLGDNPPAVPIVSVGA